MERCTVLLCGSGKLEWGEKKINHWKFYNFFQNGVISDHFLGSMLVTCNWADLC
jgi:hypothetical protein